LLFVLHSITTNETFILSLHDALPFFMAVSTVLGALSVLLFVKIDESLIGFLFAFSAGSSVYIGACDLIPEINKTRGRKAPVLVRSEEHTSELQSRENLVCRLLLEKKK